MGWVCRTSDGSEELGWNFSCQAYDKKVRCTFFSECDENCDKTNAIVAECVEELGIDAKIERVADLVEIVKLGVMTAPSVMIDGKLVISGQVPSKKQMMKVLKK